MPTPPENGRRAVVRVHVTQSALFDMVITSAEAAIVPSGMMTTRSRELLAEYENAREGRGPKHRVPLPPSLVFSETGLEVAGALFGRTRRTAEGTVLIVDRMLPIGAAIKADDFVETDPLSPVLMGDLAKSLGAPWGLIGGFHSHVLLDLKPAAIERRRLYRPSREDQEGRTFRGNKLELVLSLAFAGRTKTDVPKQAGSTVRFKIGEDFDCWLSWYLPNKSRSAKRLVVEIEDRVRPPS